MSTLTEAAYFTRRGINVAIIVLIVYIILRIFWGVTVSIFMFLFPPKPPPPNHRFGVLPRLKFPEVASPSGQLTFRLETIEGSVPPASGSAVVYFMPKALANFNGLPRAQKFAEEFQFSPEPTQETKTVFRFRDPEFPFRQLRYDIVAHNFILRYAYDQDTGLFSENNLSSGESAEAQTLNLLQQEGLFVDEYKKSPIKISFHKLVGNTLLPAPSQSQANAVRVDIFRNPVGGFPVYTPQPEVGPVSALYSGSSNPRKRILQFSYTYWPIDTKAVGTYRLKTSDQAWQDLKSGNGYIPKYPQNTTIVVRQVKIGYYDSIEEQSYLQPIFVFEGDEGFVGYVQAVAAPWVKTD